MTFTEAAEAVLRKVGKPLHYKKITQFAIEQNLLSHIGKTPEVTMSTRLATLTKTDRGDQNIVRSKPGVFALREWDALVTAGADDTSGDTSGDTDAPVAAPAPAAPPSKAPDAPRARSRRSAEGARSEDAPPRREGREGRRSVEPPAPRAASGRPPAAANSTPLALPLPPTEESVTPPAGQPNTVASPALAASSMQVSDEAAEELAPQEIATAVEGSNTVAASVAAVDATPRTDEEIERDERLAAAADMFPEEDDDEEPLLGGADKPEAGKRRRRRRRRGRNGDGREDGTAAPPSPGGEASAAATDAATPAEALDARVVRSPDEARRDEPRREESRRDDTRRDDTRRDDTRRDDARRDDARRDDARRDDARRDDTRRDEPRRDEARDDARREEEIGRDAADLVVSLLTRREDRQPVPLRALVDEGIRTGRLAGDPAVQLAALAAATRVDNVRREARGERPRLRLANGRVGLVDWTLPPELVRAEAEALAALERLRDTARRYVVRRLNELPQASFTEMTVLLLERLGISSLRTTRRPGLPQGELHLAGISRRGPEELRVAVVIRRGGEVGRERVIELRGSMHHYGPAAAAWIITTGSVLSGAREEATQQGTVPVTLVDGAGLGRLLDDNGVCVRHATVTLPYLDVDLYDALRGV